MALSKMLVNGTTDLLNLAYSYTSLAQPNNNGQIQKVTYNTAPGVLIPQCRQVKKDGVRCGSPALRGKKLCYFHARPQPAVPDVPDPSDAMAVLNWTIQGLMRRTLDSKTASQIIYSVQQMHLAR